MPSFEPYDDLGRGDPRGLWGMTCWNAMSEDHQSQLVITGKFRGYDGGTCASPAQVGIETEHDVNPGPRFYCTPCAIDYLVTHNKIYREDISGG